MPTWTKIDKEIDGETLGWGTGPWGSMPWGGSITSIWTKLAKTPDSWTKITKVEEE